MIVKQKIAALIKQKRLEKGWSQKELADGLCTQAIVSKIEKAEGSPSVELFFNLANRLEISAESITDLFHLKSVPTSSFFTKEIREALYVRAYERLDYILQLVDIGGLNEEDSLYYHFVEAVVLHGYYRRTDEALDKLRFVLQKAKEREYLNLSFEAGIAVANCYSELEQYDASYREFQSWLAFYRQVPDAQLRLLFLYSYARILYLRQEFEQAILYVEECLVLHRKEKTFYMLGHIYFLLSNILEEQGMVREAIQSAKRALAIYDIEQDNVLKNVIQVKIQRLKGEKNEEVM